MRYNKILANQHSIKQFYHRMGTITVGRYMFERLKQLGINTIFGVPGGRLYLISQLPITH